MNRRGFSLVEVMIALVILTTGILALAATAGGVTKLIALGGRLSGSAAAAEGRFETLRATTCTSLTAGSATDGIYSTSWTVTTGGTTGLLRTVVLTVSYSNGRSTRSDIYTTTISCAT